MRHTGEEFDNLLLKEPDYKAIGFRPSGVYAFLITLDVIQWERRSRCCKRGEGERESARERDSLLIRDGHRVTPIQMMCYN